MRKLGRLLLGVVLLIAGVGLSLPSAQATELRGIWVDAFGPGFLNHQQTKQLVEHCRKYNFNAVFVQMRRRGDAFYMSQSPNLEPRTTALDEDYDALADIIKQCHSAEPRIEVHCWVVSHFIWAFHKPPPQPNHVYNLHPEWLTKDSIGQTIIGQGYYLDFGHPEANRWVRDMAVDIVKRYNINGFHWDYLRYPGQDSGYNEVSISRYNKEFGLSGEPDPADPRFSEWRRRQVTDFLRWVNTDLWEIKPKLVISAAVFSNYKDSFGYRFADWVQWNKEGILDVCVPMDFSPDNKRIFNPRADFAYTNQGSRTVYLGQGAYMNTISNTIQQLKYARQKGFDGTVYYSYRNPGLGRPKPAEKDKNLIEVVADNQSAEVIGKWNTGSFGKYQKKDYLHIGKGVGHNRVIFRQKLPQPGTYDIYEWHVAGANRTTNAPFTIIHAGGTNTVTLNQQTGNAAWNHLGQFNFDGDTPAEIHVSDNFSGSNKVVIADAVRFVLRENGDENGHQTPALLQLQHQEKIFSLLKKQFQPEWVGTPELPWKQSLGMIKGTVKDEKGAPVYNSAVTLNTLPPRIQQTGPHGAFAFFNLEPGEYEIQFSDQNKDSVRVNSGQVSPVFYRVK